MLGSLPCPHSLVTTHSLYFQLFVLVRLSIVTFNDLKSRWRLVILVICLLSAIITPPDALSMIALALPMIALYGLTLLVIMQS